MPSYFMSWVSERHRPPSSGDFVRIGLLSNPLSGRNKKALPKLQELLAPEPAVLWREASTPKEAARAMGELAAEGVDVLALNGGDGTVQAALTFLINERPFPAFPKLALLPGGSTNMSAYDISGGRRSLLDSVRTLLAGLQNPQAPWQTVDRSVLQVRTHPEARPQCGLFFGAGALIQGMEYCHQRIHTRGIWDELAPAVTLVRAIYGILRNEPAFAGSAPIRFAMGGGQAQEMRVMLVLISTLERLVLGFRPFWGTEPGALHFTALRAGPERFLRNLPALLRGRPGNRLTLQAGYHSHNTESLRIWMDGVFSLDGELYEAHADQGPVEVSSAGTVSFIRL